MKRIIGLVAAWIAVVYVRSQIVENIQPWQWQWVLWVASTSAIGGCLGYVICEVRHHSRGGDWHS